MPDTSPEPPCKVALFSGHMIDAPGREKPRFPPDKEPIAARAIAEALADLEVGAGDLAICGGACGGDLLFAEVALPRGARLELYIPFDEPTFLEISVDFAEHPAVVALVSVLPLPDRAEPTRSISFACGTARAATAIGASDISP
jgi:hypothetical protein